MKVTDENVDTIPEERTLESTTTYRVLKRDSGPNLDLWHEREPLDITARYPYPNAERVGEAYGEGDYILFPTTGYAAAVTLSVVADKIYREVPKEEQ